MTKHFILFSILSALIISCGRSPVVIEMPIFFADENAGLRENECREEYDDFSSWQANNYYRLIKKYNIHEVNFDTETIYQLEDLGKVISEVLDSTGFFEYSLIKEYHDIQAKKYKAVYRIEEKEYVFETSSCGDYIDFEKNYELLKQIALNSNSNYVFAIPWFPGDQTMSIVFAPKDTLAKAINEGFPLTLDGKEWVWKDKTVWSNIKSVKTEFIKPLKQENFRKQVIETVSQLRKQGVNIRPITWDRIYITCFYESNKVNIIVDGNQFMHSSCELDDNTVTSTNEYWNVLFQYMISITYGNSIIELQKTDGTVELIGAEEMKEKIMKAQQGA